MVELSKRHRLQGKSQMYECLACSFHYITLNMCTHRKEGGGGIIQKAKKLHHQILSTEALSEDLDRPHQAAPKMHDDNHIIARYVRIYGLLYQLHAIAPSNQIAAHRPVGPFQPHACKTCSIFLQEQVGSFTTPHHQLSKNQDHHENPVRAVEISTFAPRYGGSLSGSC
jgi:hypothetical protein